MREWYLNCVNKFDFSIIMRWSVLKPSDTYFQSECGSSTHMLSSVPHAVDIMNVRSSSLLSDEQSKQVFLAISLRYYTYFSLVNHSQWIPYLTIRPQLRGHAMGKSCIIFLKTKEREIFKIDLQQCIECARKQDRAQPNGIYLLICVMENENPHIIH